LSGFFRALSESVCDWLRFAKDAGVSKKSSDSIAKVHINSDYAIEIINLL